MKKITKIICVLSIGIVMANRADAAINIYMKVAGIPGEVTLKGYEKTVMIDAISQGSTLPMTFGGGASGAGKVSIGDFSFQTALSSVIQPLMLHMYKGTYISTIDFYYVN